MVQLKLQNAGKVRELISGAGIRNRELINMVLSLYRGAIPYFSIEVWCNGNTEDFGSSISGSNPDTSTTIVNSVFIEYV